jgi:hypothetical protein
MAVFWYPVSVKSGFVHVEVQLDASLETIYF